MAYVLGDPLYDIVTLQYTASIGAGATVNPIFEYIVPSNRRGVIRSMFLALDPTTNVDQALIRFQIGGLFFFMRRSSKWRSSNSNRVIAEAYPNTEILAGERFYAFAINNDRVSRWFSASARLEIFK